MDYGDTDELAGLLDPLVASHHYVSWDEFDLTGAVEGAACMVRPYDLGALLLAGAELDREAREAGEDAWVLPDDGTGVHVLRTGSGCPEDDLLRELLRVGALMEDAARVVTSAPAVADLTGRA